MRVIQKHSTKPFSGEDWGAAVEMWKAKVFLATIRKQDGWEDPYRFLAFAKANLDAVGQEEGRQRLCEETGGGGAKQTAVNQSEVEPKIKTYMKPW